jgi:hypothetical protein
MKADEYLIIENKKKKIIKQIRIFNNTGPFLSNIIIIPLAIIFDFIFLSKKHKNN